MANQRYKIVGLGETLWDMLPNGKQLGGAPANFAYISTLLGDEGIVASRVGSDSLGSDAVGRLAALGVTTDFVQHDSVHPTGTVLVEVDHVGQPILRLPRVWPGIFWSGRPIGILWRHRRMRSVLDRLHRGALLAELQSVSFWERLGRKRCAYSTSTCGKRFFQKKS